MIRRPDSPAQWAWLGVNLSAIPVWLAMILAPRSRLTRWLTDRLVPLHTGLGLFYTGNLLAGVAGAEERFDFADMGSIQRAFQNPQTMLAGWTHYISFDLFVGRWIWEVGIEEGRSTRLALLLTLMAGPLGLTVFTAQRRFG